MAKFGVGDAVVVKTNPHRLRPRRKPYFPVVLLQMRAPGTCPISSQTPQAVVTKKGERPQR